MTKKYSNTICLYWLEPKKSWENKDSANNIKLIVDYDKSQFSLDNSYLIPNALNAIEVKRKMDIVDYLEELKNRGFISVKQK